MEISGHACPLSNWSIWGSAKFPFRCSTITFNWMLLRNTMGLKWYLCNSFYNTSNCVRDSKGKKGKASAIVLKWTPAGYFWTLFSESICSLCSEIMWTIFSFSKQLRIKWIKRTVQGVMLGNAHSKKTSGIGKTFLLDV